MLDRDEVRAAVYDLSWLDRCECSKLPLEDFFVAAGHTIPERALAIARACPTRRQEVMLAYERDIRWGYFGALSPGQRASMTLEQALEFVDADQGELRAQGLMPELPKAALAS